MIVEILLVLFFIAVLIVTDQIDKNNGDWRGR